MPNEPDTSSIENQNQLLASQKTPPIEAKYRTLFDSMAQGFCIFELIYDEAGTIVDYRFLEANRVFEEQTGLRNAAGKLGSEILPDIENYWLKTYDQVVRTGQPQRIEHQSRRNGRWYEALASRIDGPGSRQICTVFDDITERKRREANQALLTELSGDLVGLDTVEKTIECLGEKIGRHFGVRQCLFTETNDGVSLAPYGWNASDAPSLKGSYRVRDFLSEEQIEANRAGRMIVVNDTQNAPYVNAQSFAALETRSFLIVPLVRNNEWRYMLSIFDNKPREWRVDEVDLMREITERIWTRLERARIEDAVRQSEERFRALVTASSDVIYQMSPDWKEMHHLSGGNFIPDTKDPNGTWLESYIPEESRPQVWATIQQAISNKSLFDLEHQVIQTDGTVGWVFSRAVPLLDEQGELTAWFGTAKNITARKRYEQQQEFLLQLSDTLRPLSNPVEVQAVAARLLGQHLGANQVHYGEVRGEYIVISQGYGNGLPPMVGSFRALDFGERITIGYRAGQTQVCFDTTSDPTITSAEREVLAEARIAAYIAVPLIKEGHWVVTFAIHSMTPRQWTQDEIRLTEEVAERTWATVERARAEEAARESQTRTQEILESIGDIFYALDQNLVLTYVNNKAEEVWGKKREDLLGKPFLEAFPQAQGSESAQMHLQVVRDRQPVHYETVSPILHHWIAVSMFPAQNGGVSVYFHDITERKRAEEAVRRSEEKYRTLFDSIDEGYCIIQMIYDEVGQACDWRFLQVNRAFEQNNGLSNAEGKTIRELTPDIEPKWMEIYDRVAQTGEPLRFEEDSVALKRVFSLYAFRLDAPSERKVAVIFTDITERKRSEGALRQSEERFRLAALASQMYAWDVDLVARTVWYSPDAATMFGYTELPSSWYDLMTVFDSLHPRDGEAIHQEVLAAIASKNDYARTYQIKNAAGDYIWVETRGTVESDASGKPIGMRGIVLNIDARKRMEDALRQTEERFHFLTDAIPQIIWTNDAQGDANYFNSRWFEYSGLTLEQSLVSGWLAIIHPEDAPALVEQWNLAQAKGTVFDTEYRLRRADGTYRWHIGRNVPLYDDSGNILGWFGAATDIEGLKEAQLAVREKEERLRFAIDASGLGTCDWDFQAGLMRGNAQRFHMFGLQPEQGTITTRQFWEEVHPDDREATWNSIMAQITEKGEYQVEYRIIRPDDGVRWITEAGRVIEWKDVEPAHVTSILSDVTLQRESQEVLRRSHEALALTLERQLAAEASRTDLMRRIVNTQEAERGRISRELHDNLGQHLTAVMLGLQALENQISVLTGGKRKGEVPQLDTLRSLVDGLMRAAHDQARQLRPAELDALGLSAALGQYARDWSNRTEVEVDFQTVNWQERPSAEVETTLYRVAQEALTNVARHAHASFVSVVLEQNQSKVTLIVEDDGRGFDTEQTTNRLGTLGMKERLDLVGGTLEIESIPGEGTAIIATVMLPDPADTSR